MAAKKGSLSISSENIFPIIKKWVYSDHDIFARELVSNGCDAITKLKKLDMMGEYQLPDDYKPAIKVEVNPEEKTLKFTDNGLGMTADEVEEYITQIAFSGATQFLEKYKDKTTEDDMIGHFGLGFYSAFMVADEVHIDTLSYKEGAKPVHWVSNGGTEYEMEEGDKQEVGSTMTLYLNEDSLEFANEYRMREVLEKYCSFMPVEIFLSKANAEPEYETIDEADLKDDDEVIEHIHEDAKMEEKGISKEEVEGVGIGVPGPVNSKGEVSRAVNLFWGYKNVVGEMEELTGLHAEAGNDANVAALGEAWKGAAAGSSDVIMVTLGTGVGGGIIVDGKIVTGHHGAGGEIGHANVDHHETESCNCGNRGCLEQYASATGIVRMAKKELAASGENSVLRDAEEISAKAVLDAFKENDPVAVATMEKVGEQLGGALAIICCVTDPETIVIGGGVSKAGQPLIDCIRKYYREYAFESCKDTPIVIATLGNDAGIYGAAKMVL